MKIILLQDVKGLGKKDSTHEVNDGYARNFLLPKKLALEASASNMNVLNNKKESDNRKREKEVKEANQLAEKLKTIELVIKTKAGENGKLFGSITSKDIVENLKSAYGYDVDKKKIDLVDTIKSVGIYNIDLKLCSGVAAKLKVKIESE